MSQENVEAVRTFTEAYIRGDHIGAVAYLAPDVVYEVGQEVPARRPEEVLAKWRRWEADWERIELIPEEYIDAGDEVVLAVRYSGRGRASGIAFEDRLFEVHTVRDGKVARKRDFKTRSEAQKACSTGKIEVNGLPAKPHRTVRVGDRIEISRPFGRKQRIKLAGLADRHIAR